ncbi:hypothetical protein F3Y22_tig00111273pilonHSYRG00357 [Hibiscus syriacus]|uniref:WRKY domain-containing protein n=1 Tax=Hibiscus syriacus TaxID=106335 RepID=A0A6A2YS81_HIBSY|nr:hypothetical protein F3Y22_tig00111273pilonHSYRG00357 [Hibiscus syriacus]
MRREEKRKGYERMVMRKGGGIFCWYLKSLKGVNGKHCATRLQILFNNNPSEKSVFRNQANDDSTESRKKKRLASKEKRGCYKRRKAGQTWTVVSSTVEDGHAWRKYGQKQILNSKHPRFDQGCRALNKSKERTMVPKCIRTIISEPIHGPDSSQITKDWESREPYNSLSKKLHDPQFTPSNYTSTVKEEETTSGVTDMNSAIMWKDIIGADYGDVMSNVYSSTEITSHNLELDLVIKPVEFENDFQFDESEFV